MKNFLLSVLCLLSILTNAQTNPATDSTASAPVSDQVVTPDKVNPTAAILTVSMDSQGFVSILIPQTQQRDVQKDWIKYAGIGSKGKAEVINGDNLQHGAMNKNISPSQFDISCRLLGTNDGVRTTVWLTENPALISKQQHDDRMTALQKYVRDFGVMEYRQAVQNELKAAQTKQKLMENVLARSIKEKERAQKKIEDNQRSIQRANEAIVTGKHDIESTSAKIEAQKGMVDNTAADPNASKGARKTLAELESEKSGFQKQNDNHSKNIDNWTKESKAEERAIANNDERQVTQKANIEQQKQTVIQIQTKLASIK